MNCQLLGEIGAVALAALAITGCSTTKQVSPDAWMPERDPELRRLLKERYDAAVRAYEWERTKFSSGIATTEGTLRVAKLVVDAELELAETPEQRIAAWEHQLKINRELETYIETASKVGTRSVSDLHLVRCWRLAAEIGLFRAKRDFQSGR